MYGKQVWTFEMLEQMNRGVKHYGCNWKAIQSTMLPKFTQGQIKNIYYKLRMQDSSILEVQSYKPNANDLFEYDLF